MKELNNHQLLSVSGSGVLTAGFMLGQAISDITTAIVSYSVAVKDEVVFAGHTNEVLPDYQLIIQ